MYVPIENQDLFVYVDGILTKGSWLTIESTTDWDDIKSQLVEASVITAEYDGDLLIADTSGDLAQACTRGNTVNLELLAEAIDKAERGANLEALAFWISNQGTGPSLDGFESDYLGAYDDLTDWAEQTLDDSGTLADVPPELRGYIDFDSWAKDQERAGSVWTARGQPKLHVFRS